MRSEDRYPRTFDGLLQLVQHLRGPEGCPWDQEQTRDSLKRLLIEECYELVDAMEHGDARKLVEELGDVLFHVVFQIQLGSETGEFTHQQVLQTLLDKLVRRHPHVFGDVQVAGAREVETNWDAIKRKEQSGSDASILDGVPRQMPALAYAQAIQGRAARARFDWEDFQGVLAKVVEELGELEDAQSQEQRKGELGDLLFSIVNSARWLDVDAEEALRHANGRFQRRFARMERLSNERGLAFTELPMDAKEALWLEAKALEG